MRRLRARRILRAERRGSSWPVLAVTEDGQYLVKLRGAAQGTGALVAEIFAGALADALGLPVPARCLVEIDQQTVSEDRHEELRDLLARSQGTNLGLAFLEGAREFQPADAALADPILASRIVWFDGLIDNLDRTAANPNLLVRGGALWLIDHGAAFSFQHDWPSVSEASPRKPRTARAVHPLQGRATLLAEVDPDCAAVMSRQVLRAAIAEVPDSLLEPLLPPAAGPEALSRRREAYLAYLWKRLSPPRPFVTPR